MKKLFPCLGFAAIVALALTVTGETEGQAKKKTPPPKIMHVNANDLFNFRRECYDKAVRHYDPKVPGGTPAMIALTTEYQDRIQAMNVFALTANHQVHFQYRGVVGASVAAPFTSSVIFMHPARNFTDSISFTQPANALFLPLVGESVHIHGIFSPQGSLNQFPQFLTLMGNSAVITPYQGIQISLGSVRKVK